MALNGPRIHFGDAWRALWLWLNRDSYDNDEWASGIVTDADVGATRTNMFKNVPIAQYVSIRTDAAISVKFNATTNPATSIAANTTFTLDSVLLVTNIYLTASASANVKVFLS